MGVIIELSIILLLLGVMILPIKCELGKSTDARVIIGALLSIFGSISLVIIAIVAITGESSSETYDFNSHIDGLSKTILNINKAEKELNEAYEEKIKKDDKYNDTQTELISQIESYKDESKLLAGFLRNRDTLSFDEKQKLKDNIIRFNEKSKQFKERCTSNGLNEDLDIINELNKIKYLDIPSDLYEEEKTDYQGIENKEHKEFIVNPEN